MPKKQKPSRGISVITSINFESRSVTEFISQADAARQLDVSRATVNFLVSSGRLRSEVIAGRKVVFVEDVLAYKPLRPGPKKGSTKSAGVKKVKAGSTKSRK